MRSFKDGENGVNLDVLVSGDFPGDGMPKPVSFPAIQAPVENAVGDTKTVAVEPVIVPPGIAKDAADVQELIRANNLPYEFVVELDPSVKAEYVRLWDIESSLRYARNALNLTGDAERESQEGILTVIRGLLGGDPPRLRMSRNFSWLSTADSTILSTEQYDDLGLPTLVPGKPETDVCGIPVPKSYAGFALVGSDPDLHADTEDLLSLADVLWDSKKNKAVFVARCSYTYTVDNVTLAAKPYPTRGHVCREASSAPNRADLDVGLLVEPALLTGPNGTCPPDGPGNLCRMCWPCRRKRLPDRPEQARGYRFQVAVDGYGPTWDAIYWKLASNSTVFAVQHEVRYAQWFGPLLEDGANYIATSAPDLAHAVAGCVRDPEWCRRIAMAAARTFRSAFDLGQIERDWTLLLQKLHDGGVLGGTRWAKAAQQRHPLHLKVALPMAALLDRATADGDVGDRVASLDAFIGAIRADKAMLVAEPGLAARVAATAQPPAGPPLLPPEIVAASLFIAEEVACRLQGLGDARWAALADVARAVEKWLKPGMPEELYPAGAHIVVRQAIQWAANAYSVAFQRIASTHPDGADLWAAFESIRRSILARWEAASDTGELLAISRWACEAVQVESWAKRNVNDQPIPGEVPGGGDVSLDIAPTEASYFSTDELASRSTQLLEMLLHRLQESDRVPVVASIVNSMLLLVRGRYQFANMVALGIVEYWAAEEERAAKANSRWTTTQYRSLERTIRNALLGVFRFVPDLELPHPASSMLLDRLGARPSEFPHPYYVRLRELRFGERPVQKRAGTPDADASAAKRQRMDLDMRAQAMPVPGPSPAVPVPTVSPVQAIMNLLQFDTSQIPLASVIEMTLHVMRTTPDPIWNQTMTAARQIPQLIQQELSAQAAPNGPQAHAPGYRDPRLGGPAAARVEGLSAGESAAALEDADEEADEAEDLSAMPLTGRVMEPEELDEAQLAELWTDILQKMLRAESVLGGRFKGARNGWEALVGRLVAHSSLAKVEDGADEGASAETDAVVDYVAEDFRSRAELAVAYLYQLWWQETSGSDESRKRYFYCLHRLLDRISTAIDPRDRNFTKFLLDAPALDESCIDDYVLKRFVEDKDRMQLGVTTLRDIINLRPAMRERCIELLLECCVHPDKATRQFSIQMSRRWVPDNEPLTARLEKHALDSFLSIAELDLVADEAGAEDMEDDLWGIDTGFLGITDVTQRVEFFFALCSKDHEMLREIFRVYATLTPLAQRAVRHDVYPLVRNVGMHSPILLNLLRDFPEGSEGLALKCVLDLLDRGAKPTKELLATWRAAYSQRNMEPRAIIPVLPFLEKSEALGYLPDVFGLLPADAPEKSKQYGVIQSLIARLVTPPSEEEKPVMTPAELMIALHNMEDRVGVKKLISLTQICFNMSEQFKSEQLAIVLQQLVDQPKLPTIMMRTVLQCVTLHKGMIGFLQSILTRLINKRIWQNKQLWEGFIRACKMTQPQSSQVILQLPRPQMEEILAKHLELRKAVAGYIQQLPPSQRNTPRMQGILAVASQA
ncbi:Symplekin tight junction protein C terminal-domain-containing protein [Hyaloraphidium curvatum]|nr:Symplekin tight junction protein C terminal-domain-containing protein [Hyaloraphidium curvatum]